ncbi:hypothetical protein HN873_024173, partial [Arachis hypogaea]
MWDNQFGPLKTLPYTQIFKDKKNRNQRRIVGTRENDLRGETFGLKSTLRVTLFAWLSELLLEENLCRPSFSLLCPILVHDVYTRLCRFACDINGRSISFLARPPTSPPRRHVF